MTEFPSDLASQMDRSPRRVHEARVLQHAVGRPSILSAIPHRAASVEWLSRRDASTRAEEGDARAGAREPPPTPAANETTAVLAVKPRTAGDAAYVADVVDYRRVRASWESPT